VLADEPSLLQAPAWGRDDVIVFASLANRKGTIRKVSANGGDAVEVTVRDVSLGERTHMWPSFLPDGRHFLYLAWSIGTGESQERGRVYVGSIDPAEPRRHVMDGAYVRYRPADPRAAGASLPTAIPWPFSVLATRISGCVTSLAVRPCA
jgi:hypothetical protein